MTQVWGHSSWRQLSYTTPVSGWDAAFWGFALPEEPASLCWGWEGFCGQMEEETLVEMVHTGLTPAQSFPLSTVAWEL